MTTVILIVKILPLDLNTNSNSTDTDLITMTTKENVSIKETVNLPNWKIKEIL